MTPDLTDDDKADPRRAVARDDRARPLPAVAAGEAAARHPGEARDRLGAAMLYGAPKPPGERSMALTRKRRRKARQSEQ